MMLDDKNLNLDILNGLSDEEKAMALEILRELSTSGTSNKLDELKYSDFAEIPVDINTFLDDDLYLGKGIWALDAVTGERKCTLFPYWRETLNKLFPDNLTTAYNTLILSGAIGLGKAQPLDSIVLTDSGYKKMRELTMQDQIFSNDGKTHALIGIFPQGEKDVYEISFSDGTSALCCDEHLWTVYNVKSRKWQTLELKEIKENGLFQSKNCIGHKYKIPMTNPIEFETKNVDVPAYTLGALLGDGSLTQHISIACTKSDQEIIDNIKSELPAEMSIKPFHKIEYSFLSNNAENPYKRAIKKYKLDVRAEEKHIPIDYLNNSVDVRIALLQGLMDTDGSIDKNGRLTFVTCSERMRDDFKYLIQSLGGICHINEKHTSYEYKNEKRVGKNAYYLTFKLPSTIIPFRLIRKKQRLNPKCKAPFRYITDIKYIGKQECQCIYIDSKDHLYLTNDFIVTHNTLVASIALLYLLYRMLCLKDPYGYYGLMPMDKITFSMLNITIDAAKGVAWDKVQQLIQGSDWFMSHGSLNASRVAPTWQPDKHIELIFGSSNNHVIGRALFANISDEVNFQGGNAKNIDNQKKKLKKMIAQIDARMVSRFGKGTHLPTLNIIASSKDADQAFLEDYIKRKSEDSKTLIIDEPQWVVRNDKGTPNDPGAFWVAVGGKMLATELLPVDATDEMVSAYRAKGYKMIKIPPIFRRDFETNMDQALMDIAGESSVSAAKFLSGEKINAAKTTAYENPFTKDIIEVGDGPDDYLQYANFFDLSKIKPADKAKPLFIHLDMSTGSRGKGDKTGIAGVWITGKEPSIPGQEESRSLRYRLAFSVSIQAPKGHNISFIKNQNFIKWLRDQGFAVKLVSADTFQSAAVLQELSYAGFKTKIQSVDRTNSEKICLPYYYLKSAIYDRRVEIYNKCDLLTEELVNLEKEASGKIEHPEGGKYGCFVGSTKVSLVDGREVSMIELVSEYEAGKINYVYSFNHKTKCIEPKPILKAWCTQQNASLIEVELDSGKVLTCTPNHRFMMRDGSYKEAQDLQVNDSLMPLYRKYPSTKAMSKYRMYYEPIEDKWHYEHRQFAYEILDEKHLVHHRNCNPSDNTPTNLVWCSKAKHIELHKIMSTGSCSDEAKAKRNASLRLWYSDPANEGILERKRQKLSKARYAQLGWNEQDITTYRLEKQKQHEHGLELAAIAETRKQEWSNHIHDIETMFEIEWSKLTAAEKDSYSVRYQRACNPETQLKIVKAISINHKQGKYDKAYVALSKCNTESKRLKELCPTVDYDRFITIFGFDLRDLPGGPGGKRAPWITKYRKIICKDILNHKVKSVRNINRREDVYDLTVQDNHNFALSCGVFVHNSKDQSDAFCGALYDASQFAEEYAYSYGETLDATLDANLDDIENDKDRRIANFERELTNIYAEIDSFKQQQNKEELQQIQNIADGIIII